MSVDGINCFGKPCELHIFDVTVTNKQILAIKICIGVREGRIGVLAGVKYFDYALSDIKAYRTNLFNHRYQ